MTRKDEWTSPAKPISIKVTGHYQTERGMIRVSYNGFSKVTQLGGMARTPHALARLMLSEFVREDPEKWGVRDA